jgi:integrase
VRKHVIPFFGMRPLSSIRPSTVREWDSGLVGVLAVNTRSATYTNLSAILTAAVDDGLISANPCSAKSVTQPEAAVRKVVPWPLETVTAVQAGLDDRYRPMVSIGAGCGARQGEIFGLSPDDFDFVDGWLHIRRQVKRVRNRLVFGLPKSDQERRTPLPDSVARLVKEHLNAFPAKRITLPWEHPEHGDPTAVSLMFTNSAGNAILRHTFNVYHWRKALNRAGIEPSREVGMHALRHFFASTLLGAGESIKAIAEWLGHSDPAFTLRTYTHLMQTSQGRARRTIDTLFDGPGGPDGPETARRRI